MAAHIQLFVKEKFLAKMNCVGAPIRLPFRVSIDAGNRRQYEKQFTLDPVETTDSYDIFLEQLQLYNACAVADVGYFKFCIKSNPTIGRSLIVYYEISSHYSWDNTYKDADLAYLKLMGETYSSSDILGAVAHIVDNSLDAHATRVGISVNSYHHAENGINIPILTFLDDGIGMSYLSLKQMLAIRSDVPPRQDNIKTPMSLFGNSFKEAALSLGSNVLVISQTSKFRSIGLLSLSLNRNNNGLVEVPIIGYWRANQAMVADESFHDKASFEKNLNTIKQHTPFDEYSLGALFQKFRNGGGTQVLIWDFAKDVTGKKAFRWIKGDIVIHKNSSNHPDLSLASFLKFLYLEPKLSFSIQGHDVPNFSWDTMLARKRLKSQMAAGNPIQVTIGFSSPDHVENNSGMFIYWRGRLIEGYKKVGNTPSGRGRGVIGAVEVSHFIPKQEILHSKLSFHPRCWEYQTLEDCLGRNFDSYCERHPNPVDFGPRYDDNRLEWVQCNECRKWRRLHPAVDQRYLPPGDWFCPNFPYRGSCKDKEEATSDDEVQIDD